ncbi:MAG: zinc transporter ZupT [Kiritimatiellae bacterium]|nr:zinc transporter ZupT [Kiritimatiellia bacterium]
MENLLIAFVLTLIAGLSTGIGAVLAFFTKRTNFRLLSVCTGLSAGVMLYVSFMELLPSGIHELIEGGAGERPASLWALLAFFGGILLIFLIDRLVPEAENPHETHAQAEYAELRDANVETPPEAQHHVDETQRHQKNKLFRMGVFTALAIIIHNFPEGLATFLTAFEKPHLGLAIALAVALHNIPEGISVSVPIYYATGSRMKAFMWSCLSGLAEPIGAFVLWAVLALIYQNPVFTPPLFLLGLTSSAVAGIMVFISLDELLPTSRAYGKGHDSLYGLVAGMAIMALSLVFLTV